MRLVLIGAALEKLWARYEIVFPATAVERMALLCHPEGARSDGIIVVNR